VFRDASPPVSLARGRIAEDREDGRLGHGRKSGAERCSTIIAAAAGAEKADAFDKEAVRVALDSTELVMRGELASGNTAQLPRLMPGFVYLVTLPVVEQDEALEFSRRAEVLIQGAVED
jgi:hypothetical protein